MFRLHFHPVPFGIRWGVKVETEMFEDLLWVVFHRGVGFAHLHVELVRKSEMQKLIMSSGRDSRYYLRLLHLEESIKK